MRVLGLDPGYARVGYGLVDQRGSRLSYVHGGVVETGANEPFPQRLAVIFAEIQQLIRSYQPTVIAVEELFFTKNQTTGIGTAQARGVLILAAAQAHVPVFEYTPMQVKKAVTGSGRADKLQVQHMVQRLLGLSEMPQPDDMADALAVAICQQFQGALPENVAVAGYQRQARQNLKGLRVNPGRLAAQIERARQEGRPRQYWAEREAAPPRRRGQPRQGEGPRPRPGEARSRGGKK